MYYGKINKSLLFCLLFDSKYIQDYKIEKSYVHKHNKIETLSTICITNRFDPNISHCQYRVYHKGKAVENHVNSLEINPV